MNWYETNIIIVLQALQPIYDTNMNNKHYKLCPSRQLHVQG